MPRFIIKELKRPIPSFSAEPAWRRSQVKTTGLWQRATNLREGPLRSDSSSVVSSRQTSTRGICLTLLTACRQRHLEIVKTTKSSQAWSWWRVKRRALKGAHFRLQLKSTRWDRIIIADHTARSYCHQVQGTEAQVLTDYTKDEKQFSSWGNRKDLGFLPSENPFELGINLQVHSASWVIRDRMIGALKRLKQSQTSWRFEEWVSESEVEGSS